MANEDKDIVIDPNEGSTTENPKIVFTSANSSTGPREITLEATSGNNGSISFNSQSKQLFGITNSLDGTVFAISDDAGMPYFDVRDDGEVNVASTAGKWMRYPSCPAFRVTQSTSSSGFPADTVATWNQLDYNNGGHFNNDRFTAPHSGIYHFSAMLLSNNATRLFFNFRINGNEVIGTYVETYTGQNFQTGTSTMTCQLYAGDFVQVFVRSTNAYGNAYANFSGFQIG